MNKIKKIMKENIMLVFSFIVLFGCKGSDKNVTDESISDKKIMPVTADFRINETEEFPIDSIPSNVSLVLDKINPNFKNYSRDKISEIFDSLLLYNLNNIEKANLYNELLKVDENISQSLYTRLLNPIDGMKGTLHEWGDETSAIEALLDVPNNDFNDRNKFFVYSQYAKIEREDIDIPPSGAIPELRGKILELMQNKHTVRYNELLAEPDINNDQDLLNKYFINKWTIIKALGYADTLLTNGLHRDTTGNTVATRFDVGAVCPPVCPK